MADPVTRLDLELLALGELPAERAAALRARLGADPELQARLVRVEASLAAERSLPPLSLPTASPRRSWRWAWAGAVAAAAAGGAVGVALRGRPEAPTAGFRGALEVEVLLVRDGGAREVEDVVRAREGDQLQFSVAAAQAGHLAVFDVQSDGRVAVWLPSTAAAAGEPVTGAARLDAYPDPERVVFVWAPEPVGLAELEAAVAALPGPIADVDVLPGLPGAQRSVLVLEDP